LKGGFLKVKLVDIQLNIDGLLLSDDESVDDVIGRIKFFG